MKVIMFGTEELQDKSKNYGDCILIDDGKELVLYDCGSEEMANRVIEYMNKNGYSKVKVVLSHNDSDHYRGLEKLALENKIESVVTLLLLKHVEEILNVLDDKRRTREGLKKKIKEDFDNIAKLSGQNLIDVFDNKDITSLIRVVGPDKQYVIDAVAKKVDESESDNIDSETIMNAVSLQVEIDMYGKKMLLTGDACFEALKDKIIEYDLIQLPHHGKPEQANSIFDATTKRCHEIKYYISDNTGNTNGGSDDLETKGHEVYNTKSNGTISIDETSIKKIPKGNLGL